MRCECKLTECGGQGDYRRAGQRDLLYAGHACHGDGGRQKTGEPLPVKATAVMRDRWNCRSGGSYQVTITAQRNGRAIATKQLSVNATGGM